MRVSALMEVTETRLMGNRGLTLRGNMHPNLLHPSFLSIPLVPMSTGAPEYLSSEMTLLSVFLFTLTPAITALKSEFESHQFPPRNINKKFTLSHFSWKNLEDKRYS